MKVKLGTKLILASHNQGKLAEFDTMLKPFGLRIESAASHHLPEPEETGTTFEENSALKAVAAAQATGLTALADDSGLCVPGLGDAPGVYSARWAGPDKDFSQAIERIRSELQQAGIDPEGAPAYFVCVLTLADRFGTIEHVRGEVHGTLTFPPRGDKGFGYDPIFIAHGMDKTFAEIDASEKYAISHRAVALQHLQRLMQTERGR